jgi:hypothetical protein
LENLENYIVWEHLSKLGVTLLKLGSLWVMIREKKHAVQVHNQMTFRVKQLAGEKIYKSLYLSLPNEFL